VRFLVTIREVSTLSTEVDADSPADAERLAREHARRVPPSAWRVQEREIIELMEAPEDRWLRGV
jgi:hypothetical protein